MAGTTGAAPSGGRELAFNPSFWTRHGAGIEQRLAQRLRDLPGR